MCCVDHDALRLGAFAGQSGKNPVEHAKWPILQRRILLLQTIADHIDDTTDNTLVINPRNPCDSGKCGDMRAIWRALGSNKSPIRTPSIETLNHISNEINRS